MNTVGQMDITDIFRIFYPKATEYTFFSSAQGNVLQNRPHPGSQIRSQLVQKDWDHYLHIFRLNHKGKIGKNSNI